MLLFRNHEIKKIVINFQNPRKGNPSPLFTLLESVHDNRLSFSCFVSVSHVLVKITKLKTRTTTKQLLEI